MRKTLAPLLLIPLLAFSAGAAVGAMFVAPWLADDAPADGLEQPSAQETVDAGRIALHLPGHELPVIVAVSVDVGSEGPQDLPVIRDRLIRLSTGVLDMPLVTAGSVDLEAVRRAMMTVGAQEAPWIIDLEMAIVWSGES